MSISTKDHYENFLFSISEAEVNYLELSGWGFCGSDNNKTWFKESPATNCLNCGANWQYHSNHDDCLDANDNQVLDTQYKIKNEVKIYSQKEAVEKQIKQDEKLANFK